MENELEEITPAKMYRFMDLASAAGINVDEWKNFKGGVSRAAANPKYCFEWALRQRDRIVINLWHDECRLDKFGIFQEINLREVSSTEKGIRSKRAARMDDALVYAADNNVSVRAVILRRSANRKGGRVAGRILDPLVWRVVEYDKSTGRCILRRGINNSFEVDIDEELISFKEGEQRRRFVMHRKRESELRSRKLESHKRKNNGRIICEVPGCAFEFSTRYGVLGEGYAQVHHLTPLSTLSVHGAGITLDDLAVVCANCHAMIHRGGECRPMEGLIQAND